LAKYAATLVDVPRDAMNEIERLQNTIVARNLFVTRQLVSIVDAFDRSKIRVLSMKGPVLAQYAYGDVGLRQFGDLDFLVDQENVHRAIALLRGLGYRSRFEGSRRQDALAENFGHYSLRNDSVQLLIELHPRIIDRRFGYAIANSELFARAGKVSLGGRTFGALERGDLILYQCVHGAKHAWSRLEWIATFAKLLQRADYDGRKIAADAARLGATRRLALAVALSHRLFKTPASAMGPFDAHTKGVTNRLADAVFFNLFAFDPKGSPAATDHLRFQFASLDNVSDRARFAIRNAAQPSETEFALVQIPDALTCFYVPIRLGRLLARLLVP
jgi:hypothetical protein